VDSALDAVASALAFAAESGAARHLAELHRLRGLCLLRHNGRSRRGAEHDYLHTLLASTRRGHARASWILRPARSTFGGNMSAFRVNVVARNPRDETFATPPIEAVVDTGSELTWLPADALKHAGITPRQRRTFQTATQQLVSRDVGYAILAAEGYETADDVVFAEPGDMSLLGVRTLEGFGVTVDSIGHRFVARATIVTSCPAKTARLRDILRELDRKHGGAFRRLAE
jgi:predicted aspartyl protease